MNSGKFRLVTRSDFDGLVCAVLLNELNLIDDILFVHPKDMQDGKIAITNRDITTNLPYVAAAHLAFDHHESETIRNTGDRPNHIISAHAPSAARVVYDYYGGAKTFPRISQDMMAVPMAVGITDSPPALTNMGSEVPIKAATQSSGRIVTAEAARRTTIR